MYRTSYYFVQRAHVYARGESTQQRTRDPIRIGQK